MSSFGEEGRAAQDKAAAGTPHSVTDEPEAFQLFPTDGGGGLDSVSVLSTFDPVLWSGDEGAREDVARKLVGDVDPIFVRSWGRPRMDGRDTKKNRGIFNTLSLLQATATASLLDQTYVMLAREDPTFEQYLECLRGTRWASRIIVGVKGAEKQIDFAAKIIAPGRFFVICDDTLVVLKHCNEPCVAKGTADELVNVRMRELFDSGHTLVGINQSSWPVDPGQFDAQSNRPSLIYGALFAVKASAHQPTRHGPIKDDIERSVRHLATGKVARLMSWQVRKAHQPGKWQGANAGGISSQYSSAAGYAEAGAAACNALVQEFPQIIRLPRDHENDHGKGVCFLCETHQQCLVGCGGLDPASAQTNSAHTASSGAASGGAGGGVLAPRSAFPHAGRSEGTKRTRSASAVENHKARIAGVGGGSDPAGVSTEQVHKHCVGGKPTQCGPGATCDANLKEIDRELSFLTNVRPARDRESAHKSLLLDVRRDFLREGAQSSHVGLGSKSRPVPPPRSAAQPPRSSQCCDRNADAVASIQRHPPVLDKMCGTAWTSHRDGWRKVLAASLCRVYKLRTKQRSDGMQREWPHTNM